MRCLASVSVGQLTTSHLSRLISHRQSSLVTVGTAVLAVDGTFVGKVSGLSRDPRGHVGRIRVTPSILIDSAQTPLIIRSTYFSVTDHAVQLKLTVAELDALPRAMTEDKAAGSPRLF